MEKTTRLERNVAFKGRQGSTHQSDGPIYFHLYYGVFQLPIKLCDELNSMCTRFWWGTKGRFIGEAGRN